MHRNCRKSSGGTWARLKKCHSSPSGGRKVVSGVIFLSADMFRAGMDKHFFWPRPRLGPAGASPSEIPTPPPTYYFWAQQCGMLSKTTTCGLGEILHLGLGPPGIGHRQPGKLEKHAAPQAPLRKSAGQIGHCKRSGGETCGAAGATCVHART